MESIIKESFLRLSLSTLFCMVVLCSLTRLARSETTNPACLQKVDPGHCGNWTRKYYYYEKSKRCRMFWYGGCEGNDNQFDTRKLCQEACTPSKLSKAKQSSSSSASSASYWSWSSSSSSLLSSSTLSSSSSSSAHDSGTQYGTVTKDHVIPRGQNKTGKQEERDVCQLPAEQGPCYDWKIMWHFNHTRGLCKRFWYGGCEGNGNLFENKTDCVRACSTESGKLVFM